jgi:hypothetical protein
MGWPAPYEMATEIRQGLTVRFRQIDYDPDLMNYWVGIVDGDPYVTFQETNGNLEAWIPVFVPEENQHLVVAGSNVAGIDS